MRKIPGLFLTLILLSASAGCLAEEIQGELEGPDTEEKRYTFTLPTLGRDVDSANMLDLTSELQHCLLYTSPSPRDPTKSRMPSSA